MSERNLCIIDMTVDAGSNTIGGKPDIDQPRVLVQSVKPAASRSTANVLAPQVEIFDRDFTPVSPNDTSLLFGCLHCQCAFRLEL